MSILRTLIAGKVQLIKQEQHWQLEMARVVRPEQIKLKAAEQLNAVKSTLKADPDLLATFKTLKLTLPE
jgi:hypothetical protein